MGGDPMAISIQLLGIYRIADPDKVWADLADLSIKEYQAVGFRCGSPTFSSQFGVFL